MLLDSVGGNDGVDVSIVVGTGVLLLAGDVNVLDSPVVSVGIVVVDGRVLVLEVKAGVGAEVTLTDVVRGAVVVVSFTGTGGGT